MAPVNWLSSIKSLYHKESRMLHPPLLPKAVTCSVHHSLPQHYIILFLCLANRLFYSETPGHICNYCCLVVGAFVLICLLLSIVWLDMTSSHDYINPQRT